MLAHSELSDSWGRRGFLLSTAFWSWATLCLLVLQSPLTRSQVEMDCTQYNLPLSHCTGIFTSCDYVHPLSNLSLSDTETQLGSVIHLGELGVETGALSQDCFNSFLTLYCYQVYSPCMQVNGGTQMPVLEPLCQNECVRVIDIECGAGQWSYLANVIRELVQSDNVQTPELGMNCTDYNTATQNDTSCILLQQVDDGSGNCDPDDVTPDSSSGDDQISTEVIIAISVAAGVSIAMVAILLIIILGCCFKLRQLKGAETGDEETDQPVDFLPVDNPQSKAEYNRGTLMMRPSVVHGVLLSVDPTPRTGTLVKRIGTVEFLKLSPKQRIQTLEFPHSNICILKDVSETNLGKTYLGEATGLSQNEVSTTVFIKSLKERTSSKLRQQFAAEMSWVSGFDHPNILTLLGVCNKEEPRYMIFEHMEYGSLKDFLQSIDSAWFDFDVVLSDEASTCASSSNPMLGIDDLASIGCQVADGMDYLSSRAFVLRDIATRNCLIGQGLRVKIANFGFSHDLQSKEYCHVSSTKGNMPLPVRWMAPESLQNGKFSVYSDVWSFGVFLWEVFSFGAQPYSDLSNMQVVQKVLKFQVLPQPEKCPESIYKVMKKCWQKSPSKRPLLNVLRKQLSEALGSLDAADIKRFGRAPSNPDLLKL